MRLSLKELVAMGTRCYIRRWFRVNLVHFLFFAVSLLLSKLMHVDVLGFPAVCIASTRGKLLQNLKGNVVHSAHFYSTIRIRTRKSGDSCGSAIAWCVQN